MTQFNELVDNNQRALAAFYSALCTVGPTVSAEDEKSSRTFVDTPLEIYTKSMAVIASCEENGNASSDRSRSVSLA